MAINIELTKLAEHMSSSLESVEKMTFSIKPGSILYEVKNSLTILSFHDGYLLTDFLIAQNNF